MFQALHNNFNFLKFYRSNKENQPSALLGFSNLDQCVKSIVETMYADFLAAILWDVLLHLLVVRSFALMTQGGESIG